MNETDKIIDELIDEIYSGKIIKEIRKQALAEKCIFCDAMYERGAKKTAEAILSLTDKISTLHDPTDCDCCERMVEKNWQLREEIEKYLGGQNG